jgi:hypothetical protein
VSTETQCVLVYSLGLNNPPRICLIPKKLLVKNLQYDTTKRGAVDVNTKMAGARFHDR